MTDRRELEGLDDDALFRKGVAAARVGETDEARLFLQELVSRSPDHAEAHLWLAGLVEGPRAKRDHFQRVLELRPDDVDATQGLQRLEEKHGPGIVQDEDVLATVYCTWHPDRDTLLRCTRCGRAMCTECAVRHPVGMRCRQCVKELRSPIYVVPPERLLLAGTSAFAAGALLGVLLVVLSSLLFGGFFLWIIAFFAGSAAGAFVAEVAGRVAGRKRGRTMGAVVAVAMAVGTLVGVWATNLVRLVAAFPQVPIAGLASAAAAQVFGSLLLVGIFLFAAIGAAIRALR